MAVVVRKIFSPYKNHQVHHYVLSIGVSRCTSDYARVPSVGILTVCIHIESLKYIIHAVVWCSEACDCNNDEYNGWNALWSWNQKNHCCENTARRFPQSCTEVSAALKVSRRSTPRSQLLQNLTILDGALQNSLVVSGSTLLSSRGAWEHLEVLRSTGAVDQSV